jgi:DNA polymerase elongation subunit (family B)
MGINYEDTFGTVKPWTQFLTNLAIKEKLVMPYQRKSKLDKPIVGGFVREPTVGVSEWLFSIDVNSMYPLLGIVAFNMSPETYVNLDEMSEDLMKIRQEFHGHEDERVYLNEYNLQKIKEVVHKHDVSYGINAFFSKKKIGIIPKIVKDIYKQRKEAKGKMLAFKALRAKVA